MLNRDGIKKTTYGAPVQILDNVELQASVGCIVAQSVAADGKKAKAGTPVKIDLANVQTPVTKGEGANAVLLHDVDVSDGNANGTALIFGFVNVNRLDADVQALVTAGVNTVGAVTFIKH